MDVDDDGELKNMLMMMVIGWMKDGKLMLYDY